jgi:hypothetical protein
MARPEPAQSAGTVGSAGSEIVWIGIDAANWPAMRTSALRTAPQV